MTTKEEEYNKIVLYIQQYLLHNTMVPDDSDNGYEVLASGYIKNLQKELSYQGYIDSVKVGKGKKEDKAPVNTDKQFEEFWRTYPGSGNFEYRGMKFTSGRALRANKQVCKMLYDRALAEDNITPEQMLTCLKIEVLNKKMDSWKKGTNCLEYMKAVEPWLRQKAYEVWLGQEIPDEEEGVNTSI